MSYLFLSCTEADDDELHPADAESGVGMFAIFITLVIIAFILYFAFVRTLVNY